MLPLMIAACSLIERRIEGKWLRISTKSRCLMWRVTLPACRIFRVSINFFVTLFMLIALDWPWLFCIKFGNSAAPTPSLLVTNFFFAMRTEISIWLPLQLLEGFEPSLTLASIVSLVYFGRTEFPAKHQISVDVLIRRRKWQWVDFSLRKGDSSREHEDEKRRLLGKLGRS